MPGSRRTVLVVDDNVINKRIMVSQLESLGIVAESVSGGHEALERMSEQLFDAVLMDCQMPVLDGYETTRRIREAEVKDRRTIVIAVTAHGMVGERARCLAAGMDDYLAKPFRAAQLGALLDRWFGGGAGPDDQPDLEPLPEPEIAPELDPEIVERLGGLGILSRVLDLYVACLSTQMGVLHSAIDGARWADARRAVHTLRGASAQIGATRFAGLCEDIERSAAAEDSAACIENLQVLELARPRLEEAVSSCLGSSGP